MQFAKLYWYIAVPGIYYSIRGVCPPGRGMFHVLAKTGHTNMCGVVGCFRGEKTPSQEAINTEAAAARPPTSLSTALKQPINRPPAAPKQNQGRRKLSFSSRYTSKDTRATNHTPRLLSELRYVASSPSLLPGRGFRAASVYPTDPKSDRLLDGRGRKKSVTIGGAPGRAGRTRTVARWCRKGVR